jgi:hypothetical protein
MEVAIPILEEKGAEAEHFLSNANDSALLGLFILKKISY